MRTFKSILAFALSIPLLYMPIELALKGEVSGGGDIKLAEFDTYNFESSEWMTSNLSFQTESGKVVDEFFTYSEVEKMIPEGWGLPTMNEIKTLFKEVGFEAAPGTIPSTYYKIDWNFKGYEDPILGEVGDGEKMLLWIKDNGEHNYVVIDNDELVYKFGRMLPNAQLPARLIRK
ncbi:MAG: hypothetical protein HWE07_14725 [Cytophagia bacterium]|nr:hypothetical protein [Cytophagia bacterium]